MLTRDELARIVIAVLDLQKSYFCLKPDDPGKRIALEASKKAEKELRAECERVLEGPSLFGDEELRAECERVLDGPSLFGEDS